MDYIEYCLECLDFNVRPLSYDRWKEREYERDVDVK